MSAKTDTAHDDKVFELGQAYVRAHNEWHKALKQYGATSRESNEAFDIVLKIRDQIQRVQLGDKKRNKRMLGAHY